ncbi:MAG: ABC transporter permease [Pirellulales bacterium]
MQCLKGFFLRTWSIWVIVAALALTAMLIALSGRDPLTAYHALLRDGLLDRHGFADTLVKMSPLLLTSLAVIIPLRAGQYNIGGEGQMYAGALSASIPALFLDSLPLVPHLLVCSMCGMLGGAAWGLLPGLLKVGRGANEVITSLLLNYVAVNLVSYVVGGPLMEPGAPYPSSPRILSTAQLPYLLPQADVHAGFIAGLLLSMAVWLLLTRTCVGWGMQVVGENSRVAAYAGVSVGRTILLSLAAGGAMAGLAGAFEVMGVKHRLFHQFAGGYGYDGLVVAFLAGGRALWNIPSAFFIALLKIGGSVMQRAAGVPVTVVLAIEGIVVVLVAIALILPGMEAASHSESDDEALEPVSSPPE